MRCPSSCVATRFSWRGQVYVTYHGRAADSSTLCLRFASGLLGWASVSGLDCMKSTFSQLRHLTYRSKTLQVAELHRGKAFTDSTWPRPERTVPSPGSLNSSRRDMNPAAERTQASTSSIRLRTAPRMASSDV